jgi:DNA-binding winged helix-turn-helix (wHTH) protein
VGFDWTLDTASQELIRDGRRVRLQEKPFRVLRALLDAPGEAVTRESLKKRLWADDTFVDFDNNLNSAVATLRQALGDSARAPRFIETLPRIGYRWIVPDDSGDRPGISGIDSASPRPMPIAVLAAAAAIAIVVITTAFVLWPPGGPRLEPGRLATRVPNAAASFARGMFLRQQALTSSERPAALAEARDAFRAAVEADPSFASAIAEEADTVVHLSLAGSVTMPDGLEEARRLARQALAIDKNTASAHRVLGMTTLFLDWDLPAAGRAIDTAERLEPAEAGTAMAQATYASSLGRHDEAVEAARRAVALEPASYFIRSDLAFFYLAAGRNDEAAASSQEVLTVAPTFTPALVHALIANQRLGQLDKAAAAARALLEGSDAPPELVEAARAMPAPDAIRTWQQFDLDTALAQDDASSPAAAIGLALRHASLGQTDQALACLERARAGGNAWFVFLRAFPELQPLHGDPRFEHLADALARGRGHAGH